MTDARVHWFTGTTALEDIEVLDHVSQTCGGAEFEVIDGWKWGYQKRYRTIEGVEVMTDPHQPDQMPPVCVNVPGAACDWLGAERIQQLASITKPTRVDFAWDDCPFTVQEFGGWIEAGNMRTRFRKATSHTPLLGNDGNTATLGTASSTGQVVVYDRRGPVRLEMRLRGERAEHAYEMLMLPPPQWSGSFLEVLRGLVDFVDRSGATRADRAPLLPSWKAFLDGAARVVVALTGRVAPSLERVRDWMERQVAKSLHMLTESGYSLGELLELGRRRMRPSDRILLSGWVSGP